MCFRLSPSPPSLLPPAPRSLPPSLSLPLPPSLSLSLSLSLHLPSAPAAGSAAPGPTHTRGSPPAVFVRRPQTGRRLYSRNHLRRPAFWETKRRGPVENLEYVGTNFFSAVYFSRGGSSQPKQGTRALLGPRRCLRGLQNLGHSSLTPTRIKEWVFLQEGLLPSDDGTQELQPILRAYLLMWAGDGWIRPNPTGYCQRLALKGNQMKSFQLPCISRQDLATNRLTSDGGVPKQTSKRRNKPPGRPKKLRQRIGHESTWKRGPKLLF